MRKLMIAMLALAVVFGFAACDNSNSGSTSLMDQYVVALEVTGPEAYFAGDTVEKSDLTVTAVRNDGEKVPLTEDDYSLVSSVPADATSATAKEEVVATVTYEGIYQGTIQKPTAAVKAIVYKVDAINVTGPAVGEYFNTQGVADFKSGDYTITRYALAKATDTAAAALYSDTFEVTEANVKTVFGLTTAMDVDNFKTGNYELTVSAGANAITGGTNKVKITVVADELTGISVAADPVKKAVTDATSTAAEDYVVVTYSMKSGKSFVGTDAYEAVMGTGSGATVAWTDTGFTEGSVFTDEALTARASLGSYEDSETITPVANTIVSFKVAFGGVTDATEVAAGTKLELSKATVTVDASGWLAGKAPDTVPTAEEYKAALKMTVGSSNVTTFDTTPYGEGAALPVSFSLDSTAALAAYVTSDTKCVTTFTMATT